MSALLHVESLTVRYRAAVALDGVSLSLEPGEVIAVLGGNGAGKSTLLRAVMGLVRAQGAIRFDGREIGPLGAAVRARLGIGYAPQDARVFPGLTVAETLDIAGRGADRRTRRDEVLDILPPLRPLLDRPAWQLSGGERQMLSIARALMGRPRLLLLDEPTAGLTEGLVESLLAGLRARSAGGVAMLVAEQNSAAALALAGRAIVLRRGRIVREAPAGELALDEALLLDYLGA